MAWNDAELLQNMFKSYCLSVGHPAGSVIEKYVRGFLGHVQFEEIVLLLIFGHFPTYLVIFGHRSGKATNKTCFCGLGKSHQGWASYAMEHISSEVQLCSKEMMNFEENSNFDMLTEAKASKQNMLSQTSSKRLQAIVPISSKHTCLSKRVK